MIYSCNLHYVIKFVTDLKGKSKCKLIQKGSQNVRELKRRNVKCITTEKRMKILSRKK
jgi:nucleoid DNA-binding protein